MLLAGYLRIRVLVGFQIKSYGVLLSSSQDQAISFTSLVPPRRRITPQFSNFLQEGLFKSSFIDLGTEKDLISIISVIELIKYFHSSFIYCFT